MAIRQQTTEGTVESYTGAVLGTGEYNFHDDSDFYAVVWDEETKSVRRVEYATTRFPTYGNGATPDATPEVLAKAREFVRKRALETWKTRAAEEARRPYVKGKTVRVVRGRKVPLGTEGVVIWVGEATQYGAFYRNGYKARHLAFQRATGDPALYRVGIRTATGETHFTAASNCEVVNPEEWLPDLAEGERCAEDVAASQSDFRSATAGPLPIF